MQRRQFLAVTGLTTLTAGIGLALAHQSKGQGQRKISKWSSAAAPEAYTLPPFPPGMPADQQERARERLQAMNTAQRMRTVPFALVEQSEALTIYSRAVNQVRCAAFVGKVEWVGTHYGIKRIDRQRQETQLYTTEEGLPGNVILEIVGDEREAFALVQCADGAVAFCYLPAGQEKWKTLHKRTRLAQQELYNQGLYNNGRATGEDSLVLSPEVAVFVPGMLPTRGEASAPYYVFQRKSGKLVAAPWDPVIQADHPALSVTSAFLGKGKLWLGTGIGLVAVPLTFTQAAVAWSRALPTQAIWGGVALSNGQLALRVAPRQSYQGTSSHDLIAFDPVKGISADLPALPERSAGNLLALGATLYFLPQSNPRLGRGMPSSEEQVLRLAPGADAWESVTVASTPTRPGMPTGMPIGFGMMGGALPTLADEKTLPDPIAAAFVFGAPVYGGGFNMEGLGLVWLHQRFSRWLSPDAARQLPGELSGQPLAIGQRTLPDPVNPEKVWLTEGAEFVCVSRKELPQSRPLPGNFVGSGTLQTRDKVSTASAERFAVEAGSARRSIAVSKLFAGSSVFVVTDSGSGRDPLIVTEQGDVRPAPFGPPESRLPRSFGITHSVVAGPDRTFFVWDITEKTLRYWDTDAQQFLPTAIPFRPNGYGLIGGTREGLWQRTNSAFLFQAIGAGGKPQGEWQEVTFDFSSLSLSYKLSQPPNFVGLSGGILWFSVSLPNGGGLVGWDPARKALTPLQSSSSYGIFAVAAPDDTLWTAQGNGPVGLLCFDRKANRWESVPPPEGRGFDGKVLVANERAVWVLASTGFWRWDRIKRAWDCPKAAQRWDKAGGNWMDSIASAACSDGRYWIGSGKGLWRFDPEKLTWEETTTAGGISTDSALRLDLLLATKDAVWARSGSLLARLDRKSGKARLLGRESGGPTTSYVRMVEGDSTVWLLTQLGDSTLRFDPQKERFEPIPALPEGMHWTSVAPDPTDPKAAFVANAGAHGNLRRWDQRTQEAAPVESPKELNGILDLHTRAGRLYLASTSGLWCYEVAQNKWQRLLSLSGLGSFRSDPQQPKALWAVGPETVVKIA